VGVVEGKPPPEKLKRLQQRNGNSNGGVNHAFRELGLVAVRVMRGLGLPTVQAPGEAEVGPPGLNKPLATSSGVI